MREVETIRAAPFVDLRPALEEWPGHAAYGVGHDREVFAVARGRDEQLVVRAQATDVRRMVIAQRRVSSHVQPIGDHVILASARCDGRQKNATIVGWDGETRAALHLGDGIKDLNVTRDGYIWTSYFDEGVLGPHTTGAPGLVAFDARGDVRFAFQSEAAGTRPIIDAYATTIADDGSVWVYFYTDFPIVRVRANEYRVWRFGVGGGHALAIHGDHALVVGEYGNRSRARVVRLRRDGVARVVNELDVTDSDGQSLEQAKALGRGSDVFFFKERRVYLLTDWWTAAIDAYAG